MIDELPLYSRLKMASEVARTQEIIPASIFFFLHSFFPKGQDWTECTSSLYLSPLLSGVKIPGEKSLVKNPP